MRPLLNELNCLLDIQNHVTLKPGGYCAVVSERVTNQTIWLTTVRHFQPNSTRHLHSASQNLRHIPWHWLGTFSRRTFAFVFDCMEQSTRPGPKSKRDWSYTNPSVTLTLTMVSLPFALLSVGDTLPSRTRRIDPSQFMLHRGGTGSQSQLQRSAVGSQPQLSSPSVPVQLQQHSIYMNNRHNIEPWVYMKL